VLHVDTTFSLGFNKPIPMCIFGSSDNTGIGYGYVMNKLGFHLVSDPREVALRNALFHETLGTRPQI
jgi:hypothetical protein